MIRNKAIVDYAFLFICSSFLIFLSPFGLLARPFCFHCSPAGVVMKVPQPPPLSVCSYICVHISMHVCVSACVSARNELHSRWVRLITLATTDANSSNTSSSSSGGAIYFKAYKAPTEAAAAAAAAPSPSLLATRTGIYVGTNDAIMATSMGGSSGSAVPEQADPEAGRESRHCPIALPYV